MTLSTSLALVAAAAFFSAPVNAGLYPKSSAVLSITGKTYDKLIAQSNHTSIVEFYAPWCGHCKNLQPAYEKAAQNLKGLAKVAAIDCDEEANKPFCGSMGVQGFPSLKIVRPGKKPGKPIVEDYQGARSAKAIVDAVVEKIPNHVKRVTDKTVDSWLTEGGDGAKAILFSDKGTTSALLKSLAIDYLGSVSVGQVRDKEQATVDKYAITDFPTFVVLPGGSQEAVVYDGDLKKEAMSKFISEHSGTSPNPDPAPDAPKKSKAKKEKADKKVEKKSNEKADAECPVGSDKPKAASATLETEPTASPDPKVDTAKPVEVLDVAPPLAVLETEADLHDKCLQSKSKICILALLPKQADTDALLPETATQALQSLAEVQHKLSQRGIFPFYAVSADNPLAPSIRDALSLKPAEELEIIATNAKRAWVRKYAGDKYGVQEINDWVDAIKMNEGAKEKLPSVLTQDAGAADEVPTPEPEAEKREESESERVDEPEAPTDPPVVVTEGPIVIEIEEMQDELRDEL